MTDINNLFFELIRVAIGNQVCLSRTPSKVEWQELYAMAKKQSLVGICFAGVQKLNTDLFDNNSDRCSSFIANLSESLRLQWMGMAAKIQQRNELVNRQCVEVHKLLTSDGFETCILKGQGVAQLYASTGSAQASSNLCGLRQSGDIDVWVLPKESETEKDHVVRVVKYAKGFNPDSHFSGKHIDLSVFRDTEVELHVIPAKMNCPWHNNRLQKWFQETIDGAMFLEDNGFKVPKTEFNIVYLLLHCYDHLLFEGVGLRQIMDYYFVLVNTNFHKSSTNYSLILSRLGLLRFASAMMWVLQYVFGLDKEYLIVDPNEKEGRFLLNEIMNGGNFGKYGKDGVMEGHAKGKVAFAIASMKHKMSFLTHYPSEIIWSPYAMLSYWIWKRTVKI